MKRIFLTPPPPCSAGGESAFPPLRVSNAVVDSLTVGFALGAALGDVGAEHRPDPRVGGEAPGELLAIWIPAVVLAQVSGKHKTSAVVPCNRTGVGPSRRYSLAGVGLRCECVVMGILRVPALTRESCRRYVHSPSVAPSSALVTLARFRHITFRGSICERAGRHLRWSTSSL